MVVWLPADSGEFEEAHEGGYVVGLDRVVEVCLPHLGGAGEVLGGWAVLVVAVLVDELFGFVEGFGARVHWFPFQQVQGVRVWSSSSIQPFQHLPQGSHWGPGSGLFVVCKFSVSSVQRSWLSHVVGWAM